MESKSTNTKSRKPRTHKVNPERRVASGPELTAGEQERMNKIIESVRQTPAGKNGLTPGRITALLINADIIGTLSRNGRRAEAMTALLWADRAPNIKLSYPRAEAFIGYAEDTIEKAAKFLDDAGVTVQIEPAAPGPAGFRSVPLRRFADLTNPDVVANVKAKIVRLACGVKAGVSPVQAPHIGTAPQIDVEAPQSDTSCRSGVTTQRSGVTDHRTGVTNPPDSATDKGKKFKGSRALTAKASTDCGGSRPHAPGRAAPRSTATPHELESALNAYAVPPVEEAETLQPPAGGPITLSPLAAMPVQPTLEPTGVVSVKPEIEDMDLRAAFFGEADHIVPSSPATFPRTPKPTPEDVTVMIAAVRQATAAIRPDSQWDSVARRLLAGGVQPSAVLKFSEQHRAIEGCTPSPEGLAACIRALRELNAA